MVSGGEKTESRCFSGLRLARHVPGYDEKLDHAAFDPGVERAVTRAAHLGPDNPATGVGGLVQAVLRT